MIAHSIYHFPLPYGRKYHVSGFSNSGCYRKTERTLAKEGLQLHGIDRILSHWQLGSVIIRCPACPEPDFNIDKNWTDTLPKMRSID